MSQDIQYIRQQLKSCEEVESPYDIKIGKHVKYITLEDESEFFYEGGNYANCKSEKFLCCATITVCAVHQADFQMGRSRW